MNKWSACIRHGMGSIPHQIYQFHFYLLQSLIGIGTRSTYLENLFQVIYIPSRIVMEEIFLNKKFNGKLICGFNVFVTNFNSKFINSHFLSKQFRNSIDPMFDLYTSLEDVF